ncbi:MAG: hypothetical protein WCI51_14505, partial [Lentisphaerota bacterium]
SAGLHELKFQFSGKLQVLYNRYLYRKYPISEVEKWLEIPLDSVVANELKKMDASLPTWTRLKNLDKNNSEQYQKAALEIAETKKIKRVHLDIFLWLDNR